MCAMPCGMCVLGLSIPVSGMCLILSVDTGFLRATFFCSQPGFLAALIYEGFLPMANRIAGARKYCVLPKVCACVSV